MRTSVCTTGCTVPGGYGWNTFTLFPILAMIFGMLLQTYVNNKTVTNQVSDSRVKNTTKNIDGSCTMLHHKHVD